MLDVRLCRSAVLLSVLHRVGVDDQVVNGPAAWTRPCQGAEPIEHPLTRGATTESRSARWTRLRCRACAAPDDDVRTLLEIAHGGLQQARENTAERHPASHLTLEGSWRHRVQALCELRFRLKAFRILVYQSSLAPMRNTRGGTMASGRRNELPELQLVF